MNISVTPTKSSDGSCMGCGTNLLVRMIRANNIEVRFCIDCLRHIMKQAQP